MALQTEAIDNRLEALKQDNRRMLFDSKIRSIRMDDKASPLAGNRAAKQATRKPDLADPVDQVVNLLEELSRRIDGLEKRDRSRASELRHQMRSDQRRMSIVVLGSLSLASVMTGNWFFHWF